MNKENTIKIAESLAEQSFLCSEAVFKALAESQNIQSKHIPKIATGFAAGVGRSGELCGAITGAILGLGLKFGRNKPKDLPFEKSPHWYSTEFVNQIKKKQWKITCKDILELDLSETEDRKIYNQLDHWNTTCREIIKDSTALAWDLLHTNQ
jgi:C_GCAxxG_C_C family probable redox protein